MKFANDIQKNIYYRSQIDYCYYALEGLSKDDRHPIERMIDNASGYDKVVMKEKIASAKSLLKTIIRCKKALGYDIGNDSKMLKEVNKFEK